MSNDPVMNVTETVLKNLEDQHDWVSLEVRNVLGQPRPLIRGVPPRRLYIHPDDQISALAGEHFTGVRARLDPECEWVLPICLSEKWSLASFAAVFDSIPRDSRWGKRIVLATSQSDSTVVYYVMHEGMVKPRQN